MITMEIVVLVLLAYVIGSIPTGLIIGKLCFHTDVRQYGSKNIGATNTYRVLGMKAALPVFLGDAGKGAIGVLLFSPNPEWMIVGGLCAMIGHNWSIFLRFSGCDRIGCAYCIITDGSVNLLCCVGHHREVHILCIFRVHRSSHVSTYCHVLFI